MLFYRLFNRSNPETLTMTAVSHLALGTVTVGQEVKDAVVTIETSLSSTPTTIGPLTLEGPSSDKDAKKTGPFVYKFSYWAK